MELMRFTCGHFFTTPFLFTRLKGEPNSPWWGRSAMYDRTPEELECENFSMLGAVSFGAPPARTSVGKGADPS